LFGKNVTAGLMNITTNAPDKHSSVHVEGGWRSYGDEIYQPVVNLSLGGGWSVRAAGSFDHNDRGQFWNTDLKRPEMNPLQDSGRFRVRYDSGENWTMDLGAWLSYQGQNFNQQQLFIDQPHMLALDKQYDPQFHSTISNYVSEDVPSNQNSTARGASVTFNGDFGNPGGMESLHLIAITGVAENVIGSRDIDADFSPVPFIRDSLVKPEPERQFTQELRVTGIAPDLFGLGHDANFVAGLYFDDYSLNTSDNFQIENLGATLNYILAAKEDNHSTALPYYYIPVLNLVPVTSPQAPCSVPGLLNLSSTPGVGLDCVLGLIQGLTGQSLIPPQTAQSGLNERTKDYAAFGQGEWFFTNKWSLILGLRFAKEDRSGDPHSQSSSEIIKAIADQSNFSESLHRVETDFSPKVGVKYQPSKHAEAYFTWSEGYKSGGFNGIPLNPTAVEYQPENARSYEAGYKIKDYLAGGPIRGNISFYHTDFGNLQVSTFEGTNVVVVNAAAARSQGFESDIMWLMPVRGLSLRASYGFADARYTQYPFGPAPGDGKCKKFSPGQNTKQMATTCDLTNEPLPFAPQWTAALTPGYSMDLPWSLAASATVDILYQSSRYLNPEDDNRDLQPSTLLINPQLFIAESSSDRWAASFGVHNVTKQVYSDQVIDQPLAPGNFAAVRSDRGRFYTANFYINFRDFR
jgi:iron complex outermembrane recepter protein